MRTVESVEIRDYKLLIVFIYHKAINASNIQQMGVLELVRRFMDLLLFFMPLKQLTLYTQKKLFKVVLLLRETFFCSCLGSNILKFQDQISATLKGLITVQNLPFVGVTEEIVGQKLQMLYISVSLTLLLFCLASFVNFFMLKII